MRRVRLYGTTSGLAFELVMVDWLTDSAVGAVVSMVIVRPDETLLTLPKSVSQRLRRLSCGSPYTHGDAQRKTMIQPA